MCTHLPWVVNVVMDDILCTNEWWMLSWMTLYAQMNVCAVEMGEDGKDWVWQGTLQLLTFLSLKL